jgi:hypothetical protein
VSTVLIECRAHAEKVLQEYPFRSRLKMAGAHRHRQSARCTLIADLDETAAVDRLNSHFGYGGNPHTRRNHCENCGELSAFKDDVGRHAGFSAGFNRAVTKTVAFLEQQKAAFFRDLFKWDEKCSEGTLNYA